ncbi:MAG: tyrosine-protein phosphatase [Clostridia bacterium]|nr:tyrosine-protein phosphatase [Clostridia bacterium]
MFRFRKWVSCVCLLLAFGLVLTACGGTPAVSDGGEEPFSDNSSVTTTTAPSAQDGDGTTTDSAPPLEETDATTGGTDSAGKTETTGQGGTKVPTKTGGGTATTTGKQTTAKGTTTTQKSTTPTASAPAEDANWKVEIALKTPANGTKNVQITNDLILSFVSEEYTLTGCDKYFDLLSDKYAPAKVTFAWEGDDSSYTLLLAENNRFANAEAYTVTGKSLVLDGLKGGTTYYWKVWGDKVKSDVYSFTTAATPRTVYIEGVTNTRDMGGWKTADGGRMKQGMLFRTGLLDNITQKGIDYSLNVLKVKTELDLRKPDEGNSGTSSLGPTVNYINISSPYYGQSDGSIYLESNHAALVKIMRVFADEDNYPILFHCSVGRDRTGTVAFLLQALCGMSEEDIFREYDLSFFSANGDHKPSVMHSNFFLPLVKGIDKYSTGNWQQNVTKYLLDIGMTEAELAAIKKNLIEYT